MSPLHQNTKTSPKPSTTTNYIHFITAHAVPYSMTLDEIRSEISSDTEMTSLLTAIRTGRFVDDYKRYEKFKHEFTKYDGIVLRCNRIALPRKLRKRALEIAHESHSGIAKTK